MDTRIEYSKNSTGFVWFVDALINGGWKNVSSHKTEAEAEQVAAELRGEK